MIKDHAPFDHKEALNYYRSGHTLLLKNAEKSHSALNDLDPTLLYS